MKKTLLSLAMLAVSVMVQAVSYCAPASWGYAGTRVTGGGNATPTLVKSESELKSALKNSNQVIILTKNITVSNQISTDKSNLTIMALPGVRLISTQQTQSVSGILYLKGSNIILRNLVFEGPGAYDCDGKDNLTLDGAKNVWVDHCDFQDGCDGNFDIKGKSDNITVSWCRFRYLKAPKAGGSGGADDHRFSNLVGSSSTDKPSDGTYNITYGFCWWDEGCKQRMTRCRNCELHFLNCYWNSSVADYYVGPENAVCYFEGCTFAGSANSAKNIFKTFNNTSNACLFVHCTGKVPENSGTVKAPEYAYDALTAATAKNYVTNACGAGATLTVDEQAEVSSACDNESGQGGQGGQGGEQTAGGECCVNLSLGEEPTVANAGIPEDFAGLSVVVNLAKGKWEQGFLNMGGNADYITFDFSAYTNPVVSVAFDVTIPNWAEGKNTVAYHWNNDANTLYPVSSAETETVRLQAPASARSFTIQRSAGTSTRIAGVCFQLAESSALNPHSAVATHRKMLRDGQLLIVGGENVYTISGQQIQ
ncbi:MAG: hypothetical protein IJR09_03130 [Paludibacteraceae bacterium]|nr:hypothetical protein [Paludibacteraceae bacterium]